MTSQKIRQLFFCLLLPLTFFSFESCKKEITQQPPTEVEALSGSRLKLNRKSFDEIYQKLRKTENKQNLKEFLTLKSQNPEFVSFMVSNLDSKPSLTATMLATSALKTANKTSSIHKGINNQISSNTIGGDETFPPYDEVLDDLIDDQAFSALLNQEGEIQVDNIIYKVTPYGTFFTTAGNEALLMSVFNNVYLQNDYTLRLENLSVPISMNDINVQGTAYNDVMLLESQIFFVDSFIESQELIPMPIGFPDDNQIYPLIFPTPTFVPDNNPNPTSDIPLERRQTNYLSVAPVTSMPGETDAAYQNMTEYNIEFKSGIGSIIQTLFENSTRYNNFNSDYRMSALMYNRNYAVIKTLGIKVKFQKKGWFWWNKKETQEIRAGWDYIAYSSATSVPKISLPSSDNPPSIGAPYLINPYENPYYGSPVWGTTNGTRYNIYGWNMKRGSNEMFSVIIPGFLVPFKPDGYEVKSSAFKGAVKIGWNALKEILVKSAPPSGTSLLNNNPNNYKFPVYSLNSNEVKYLSINEMENMPKSFNSTILRDDVLKDSKIHTFVSPYEQASYNEDMIDIPLDFSTVNISISTNPSNFALSVAQVGKSLLTQELVKSFEVKTASIFGAVKYNNQWRGIRLKVKMKD